MSAGVSQGHGGEFSLTGGHSLGSNSESSGGTVEIYGGTALSSKGGNVKLISGETVASGSSSGSIDLVSSPSSMTGSINIIAAINLRRVDADYFDRMVCEQFDGERGLARCRRAHQAHGVWKRDSSSTAHH